MLSGRVIGLVRRILLIGVRCGGQMDSFRVKAVGRHRRGQVCGWRETVARVRLGFEWLTTKVRRLGFDGCLGF